MTHALATALLLAGCWDEAEQDVPADAPSSRPAAPVALALPAAPGSMTPALAAEGDDLLLVWQEPVPDGHAVRFSRLHAGTWTPPATLASGPDVLANWADYPSVAVSPDGSLIAHWLREAEGHGAYDIELVRSTDGGRTWASLGRPYTDTTVGEHGFVSYLAEAAGLRMFWLDGRAAGGHGSHGSTQLRTALVTAEGARDEQVVDDRVCDCCGTDAAGGVVLYRDRDAAERRDVSAARRDGPWSAGHAVGGEGWEIQGCPVNGPAVSATRAGLVAAWFTGAGDDQRVRAAFAATAGAAFGPPIDVATPTGEARPVGRVDVVADADGTALVTWVSAEGSDGQVRVRRAASDGRVGATLALGPADTARATGFPRLVATPEGFVAAWTDASGIVAVRFPGEAVPPVDQRPAVASPAAPPASLPAFVLTDLAGATVRSADLAGKPVLLNVWATWCGPCRDELPELVAIQTGHPDLAVLAVSVDGPQAAESVRKMTERLAPGLRVLHPDAAGLASRLAVTALPRTFLFDARGELRWSSTGALRTTDPGLAAALAAM
ncbi:MAG: redoxin domain-containing protein [Myxococcota bacterium]